MNYKKTWFGWLNFTIGTISVSVFIFTLLVSLFEFNGLTVSLFNYPWARVSFIASLGVILVVIGLLFLIHLLKKRIKLSDLFFDHKIFELIYALGIVCFFATGIYLRYRSFIEIDESSLVNSSNYLRIIAFFNGNTNGVTDVFVMAFCYFYSFLLKVFGLDVSVLIITNIIFQLLGALFIAGSFRYSYGKTVSLGAFSLLMVLTTSVSSCMTVSADCFIFFWISLIISLFSALLRDREQGFMKSNSNICLFIMFGIIFGFLVFVNPIYFIIPLYFSCRIMLLGLNDDQEDILVNRRLLPVSVIWITTVFSALVGIFFDAIGYGISFSAEISDYVSKIGYSEIIRIFYPDGLIVVCLIILIPVLCGYINFIFGKKDNISAITLTISVLYVVYARNIIAFDTSLYLIVFMGALMGVGIKSLLFEGYGEPNAHDITLSESEADDDNEADSVESDNEADSVESDIDKTDDDKVDDDKVDSDEVDSDKVDDDKVDSDEVDSDKVDDDKVGSEEIDNEVVDSTEVESLLSDVVNVENRSEDYVETNMDDYVEYDTDNHAMEIPFVPIENVLPVPKAHVKKSMGFPVEPGEKYMKYDYEISDNDDFDIE